MSRIAIFVDSGTDVPEEYIRRYGIYMLPLTIQYEHQCFHDRVDITPEEVMQRLETEIPKTSLPSMGEAQDLFRKIHADGFRQVLVVTISSGLSGTCNLLRLAAAEMPDMDIRLVDTKNIGIGAGITAIRAAELAEQGKTMDEILPILEKLIRQTKVYFCVDTLRYLQKGGRIGLVSAAVGTLLGIRPVISCNEEGIYYTVHKARGARAAVSSAVRCVLEAAQGHSNLRVLVAHTGAPEQAAKLAEELKAHLDCQLIIAPISPALVVHTGPGLLGVGVQYD